MLAYPVITAIILCVLAAAVLRQYAQRRRAHQAAWSAALLAGAAGAVAYVLCVLLHDNAALFRVYYIGGALLTAPLLGLGSTYLLPGAVWARIYLVLAAVGGAVGVVALAVQRLDRTALSAIGYGPGTAVVHGAVALTALVLLNTLGTVGVVGVALWSIYRAARRGDPWRYVGGNALIAGGTLVIAAAGGLARLGHGAGFWATMTLGWLIVYGGFALMAAYRPLARPAQGEAPA